MTERSKAELEQIAMDAIRDFVNRPEADGIHRALLDAYDKQAAESARLREAWVVDCGNLEMAEAKVRELEVALATQREKVQAEHLIAWLHARNEFDYDQCKHGFYMGGPTDGQPYAMCERAGTALAEELAGEQPQCRHGRTRCACLVNYGEPQ